MTIKMILVERGHESEHFMQDDSTKAKQTIQPED